MKKLGLFLVLLAFISSTYAGESFYKLETKFGGISTDNLGGVGGSKAALTISSNLCAESFCLGGSTWVVTEGMDDDLGIVPKKGYTVEATSHPEKLFLYGVRHSNDYKFFTQTAAILGVSYNGLRAAFLAPITTDNGTGRWGFSTALRSPLTKEVYTVFEYEYYGTQDPDVKASRIGVGLGYTFK